MKIRRSVLDLFLLLATIACLSWGATASSGNEKKVAGELRDQRTMHTKSLVNEDGSATSVVSSAPLHFQDDTGVWQDVDTSLRQDFGGAFRCDTNTMRTLIANTADKGMSLKGVSRRGYGAISFHPIGSSKARAERKSETEVLFEQVWPGVDIEYAMLSGALKESVYLKSPKAASTRLEFAISCKGLRASLQADGSLAFRDAQDQPVLTIPVPFMYDSSPSPRQGKVTYLLRDYGDNVELVLQPDKEWLADGETVYPIVIDPTAYLSDPQGSNGISPVVSATIYQSQNISWSAALRGWRILFATWAEMFDIFQDTTSKVWDQMLGSGWKYPSGSFYAPVTGSSVIKMWLTSQISYCEGSAQFTYNNLLPAPNIWGKYCGYANGLSFSWYAVGGNTNGYQLWVTRVSDGAPVYPVTNVPLNTLRREAALGPGTYKVWVRAVGSDGTLGDVVSAVTTVATTPNPPGTPYLSSPSGGSLTATWAASTMGSDNNSYKYNVTVYRNGAWFHDYPAWPTTPWNETGLPSGQYTVQVQAVDATEGSEAGFCAGHSSSSVTSNAVTL